MQVFLRKATDNDATALAGLSAQLGYTISADATISNLQVLAASNNDIVYVAVCDEIVAGWIHVFYTIRVESGQFCEIGGLVVDETYRAKGIGKLLLDAARSWCAEKGCNKLKVRSNIKRKDAHRFYTNAGYSEIKIQKVFETEI